MAQKMHAVMEAYSITATNIDARIRNFKSNNEDFDNGNVLTMGDISKNRNETEVYEALLYDATKKNKTYIAFDAIEVITEDASGNEYKLGQSNPTAFTNGKGRVFTAFQVDIGDEINLSVDGFDAPEAGTNKYANPVAGSKKFAWSSTPNATGLSFEIVRKHYVSVPSKNFISNRLPSYILRCVAV